MFSCILVPVCPCHLCWQSETQSYITAVLFAFSESLLLTIHLWVCCILVTSLNHWTTVYCHLLFPTKKALTIWWPDTIWKLGSELRLWSSPWSWIEKQIEITKVWPWYTPTQRHGKLKQIDQIAGLFAWNSLDTVWVLSVGRRWNWFQDISGEILKAKVSQHEHAAVDHTVGWSHSWKCLDMYDVFRCLLIIGWPFEAMSVNP